MVDTDTFLTTLYVMVDDFCRTCLPPESHPGPQAALSRSETVTLALFGQWQGFGSERGFYRSAHHHLRAAFPTLPSREQFNRQVRQQEDALVACFLYLVQVLAAQQCPYEALDSSGNQQTWWRVYGAQVICPPKRNSRAPWPQRLRRWLAGVRQIVETVYEKSLLVNSPQHPLSADLFSAICYNNNFCSLKEVDSPT